VLQVIFYPGALYRLMGIAANELTNRYLDGEIFFSTELREVIEKLYHAAGYGSMIEVVNTFVRGMIKKQKHRRLPIDDACVLLLNSDRKFGLQQLSKEACLSSRQLERRFKELTGVNPKLYERIIRFDRAFRLRNSHPEMDWLRIAVECNYHDYQHLVKEYKDFTGLGPHAFHEIENKAPERKFGLSEGYYG
jgi:AraC-like DNA-binding protein